MVYHVNCQGQEAKVTPEQAVAAFFTKVRQIVELNNISSKFLTVAVPNFLTHQERQALLDSLEVARRSNNDQQGIQLVNESAAVGLDYGFYKKGEFA
jgi:molecular chaperone DnaK (HSP70)